MYHTQEIYLKDALSPSAASLSNTPSPNRKPSTPARTCTTLATWLLSYGSVFTMRHLNFRIRVVAGDNIDSLPV